MSKSDLIRSSASKYLLGFPWILRSFLGTIKFKVETFLGGGGEEGGAIRFSSLLLDKNWYGLSKQPYDLSLRLVCTHDRGQDPSRQTDLLRSLIGETHRLRSFTKGNDSYFACPSRNPRLSQPLKATESPEKVSVEGQGYRFLYGSVHIGKGYL